MDSTVGQITGLSTSTSYSIHAGFWVMDDTCGFEVVPLPGYTNPPTDPDGDCIFEDLNGNGRLDFADVVLYFNQMEWIAANEPVGAFDLNANGRIDFADIVQLFGEI
jgi:PKD repeat protein